MMIGILTRRLKIPALALALLCCYPALTLAGGKDDKSPYVSVGKLTASVIDDSRPSGVAVVDVNLALANMADKDKVTAMLPLLHDRYLQVLTQLASSTYSLKRPIDILYLTSALQQVTDKVVGSGLARVQITDAILQSL